MANIICSTCTTLHELLFNRQDITLFGTKGYWQNTWVYEDDTINSQYDENKVVIKTLKFINNYKNRFMSITEQML